MEYKIIDKEEIPVRTKKGKWTSILDPLEFNKAIAFEFSTMEDAIRYAVNACGTSRKGRRDYKVGFRRVPNGNGCTLYLFKEKRV